MLDPNEAKRRLRSIGFVDLDESTLRHVNIQEAVFTTARFKDGGLELDGEDSVAEGLKSPYIITVDSLYDLDTELVRHHLMKADERSRDPQPTIRLGDVTYGIHLKQDDKMSEEEHCSRCVFRICGCCMCPDGLDCSTGHWELD